MNARLSNVFTDAKSQAAKRTLAADLKGLISVFRVLESCSPVPYRLTVCGVKMTCGTVNDQCVCYCG